MAMADTVDQRIAQSITAMEQRLAEPWRVRDLAALADLSPSRFAHLFRESIGVSPLRYLHDLRMERARHLLERTSLQVKDVMPLVGYADPSHFSKDFRRHFGVGPREYRHDFGVATARGLGDRLAHG